ncbi:MAG: SWIM zinc finger family protein, partial [Acidobacteriota bacterium]|nr:SWIM zinc finger family protein [Acidobacteriota bacterium]
MSVSAKVSQEFSAKVRERGRLYFLGGTVRVKRGDDQQVEATVRGTENYRIKLSWQKNKLLVVCSCPYYETEGPCKHIWATLLTAEQKGYLKTADAQARLRLEFDEHVVPEWPEDDEADEYDDELDDEADDDDEDEDDEDEDDELDQELAAGRKLIGASPSRGATTSAAAAKPRQPVPA